MSQTVAPDFLLTTRGVQRELGAFVVGTAFNRAGTAVAFALGDGSLRLVTLADPAEWREVAVHDGAILRLDQDAGPDGFITGGDDGKFCRISTAGEVTEIANFGMKWVEQIASYAPEKGDKGKGLLACAVGKFVHVFDTDGKLLKIIQINVPYPADAAPAIGNTPKPGPDGFTGTGNQNMMPGAPWALCITPKGPKAQVLYVADSFPGRIYKLDLDGHVLGWLGQTGKQLKQFGWIHEIACPSENELYVGELLNWRLQKLILHPDRAK